MAVLRRCLILDPMHESIVQMLLAIGWQGIDVSTKSLDEVKPLLATVEGLFVRTRVRVDAVLLGEKPNIKFVARAGAGLDNLDLTYLNLHKIHVLHASEGNRDAVGEYTLGSLIALLRNIPKADKEVRSFAWLREENRGLEIMGKTVGIIGYGNMGQAFAQRLRGFSCSVLAFDKYRSVYSDAYASESSLETIFQEADIVSMHVPLTAETNNMVNADFFKSFQKQIVFVNTSRGEIVKLATLAEVIRSGQVKGAILDVLENEKLTSLTQEQQDALDYLFSQKNVLFTPHIAGWTRESHVKINQVLIQKLQAINFE